MTAMNFDGGHGICGLFSDLMECADSFLVRAGKYYSLPVDEINVMPADILHGIHDLLGESAADGSDHKFLPSLLLS